MLPSLQQRLVRRSRRAFRGQIRSREHDDVVGMAECSTSVRQLFVCACVDLREDLISLFDVGIINDYVVVVPLPLHQQTPEKIGVDLRRPTFARTENRYKRFPSRYALVVLPADLV